MKRHGLVLFFTLCASLLFSSCMTRKEREQWNKDMEKVSLWNYYNRKYNGSTKKEIIGKFGAPDRIIDMGDGEEIIIYEKITTKTTTSTSNSGTTSISHTDKNGITITSNRSDTYGPQSTSTTSTTTSRDFKEFYIDKNGKCYSVKTNDWTYRKYLPDDYYSN